MASAGRSTLRVLKVVAGCLVLGAVINLAVAWAGAWLQRDFYNNIERVQTLRAIRQQFIDKNGDASRVPWSRGVFESRWGDVIVLEGAGADELVHMDGWPARS